MVVLLNAVAVVHIRASFDSHDLLRVDEHDESLLRKEVESVEIDVD